MKKGGYQILDLKGQELHVETFELEDSYKILNNSNGKPILVSGIVIDGEKKNDVFVTPVYDSENETWSFELYGFNIEIQDDSWLRMQSKLIELETPHVIVQEEISYIGDTTLALTIFAKSTLGVDVSRIKRIYSASNNGWYYPISCLDATINFLSNDELVVGETIDKVELY